MTKGSKHTLGLILGIVAVALGVFLLVPFVKENVAGQAVAASPSDYVAKWSFDREDLSLTDDGTKKNYTLIDDAGSFPGEVLVSRYPIQHTGICGEWPEAVQKTVARAINASINGPPEFGLAGWWRFESEDTLNIFNGTETNDFLTLTPTPTPTPTPTYSTGKVGEAISLDCDGCFLSVVDDDGITAVDKLDLSSKTMIELWYQQTPTTTGTQRLLGKRDSATNPGYDIWLDTDKNLVYFNVSDGTTTCTTTVTAADDTNWHSVVAEFYLTNSKPDLSLHYDGKYFGNQANRTVCNAISGINAVQNEQAFSIGRGYYPSAEGYPFLGNFNGNIDEVSVWQGSWDADYIRVPFASSQKTGANALNVGGVRGSGMQFDGYNDYVNIPYSSELQPLERVSVSAWVNPKAAGPYQFINTIIHTGRYSGTESINAYGSGYFLYLQDLKPKFLIGVGDSYPFVDNDAKLPLNTWSHLVGMYDGQKLRLYVNGQLVREAAESRPLFYDSEDLRLGARRSSCMSDSFFKGSLDEVAIYNRGLSSDEVEALYREGLGAFCFNKHCPTLEQISTLPVTFTDGGSSLQVLNISLRTKISLPEVADEASAVDLVQHHPSYSVAYPFAELTTTDEPQVIGYFRYNSLYTIQLTEYNQQEGTATLRVVPSTDNTPVTTSTPITLSIISEAKPLEMAPVTALLNLNAGLPPGAGSEPEVYLHARGFFQKDGKLGIIAIASPFLDLSLLGSGTTILAQPNPQKIKADGSLHTISFANVAGSTLFLVDGKEYSSTNPAWEIVGDSKKLTHFYDGTHTRGLTFTDSGTVDRYWKLTVETFPPDLSKTYKTTFTKDSAAILNSKTFKICTLDSASLFSVNVCDENDNEQSSIKLQADIPYYNQSIGHNLLFLYDDPAAGTAKEVQVFHLFNLSYRTQQNDVTFTNNLVANRPLAFVLKDVEENNNYYLLTHPTALYFDPKDLKLLPLGNSILREFSAVATRYEAKFNLPVGKVIEVSSDGRVRQVNVEDLAPAPYFNISGVVNVENRVNLFQELQTSVSTYGSVIMEPGTGLGLVATHEDDRLSDSEEMKIQYAEGTAPPTVVTLKKDVPVVLPAASEKVLVHFTKTDPQSGIWTKYANIHHYYDLTTSPDNNPLTHPFTDDDFILPLLKGNQLALGLDDSYYLLSYDGTGFDTSTGLLTTLFAINKLKLKRIGGTETLGTPIYDAAKRTASFPLSNGRSILLSLGSKGMPGSELPIVNMTSINAAEARRSAQQKQVTIFDYTRMFEAELPQPSSTDIENVLQVGASAGSPQYKNCDNQYTQEFEQTMLLCAGTSTNELKLSEVRDTIDGNAIITYRNKSGAAKKVTFQRVLGTLSSPDQSLPDALEWGVLTTNLTQGKHPVLKIGGTYYELDGGQSFNQLKLRNISSGQDSPLIQVYNTAEGAQEGYITLGTEVISVKQSLQDYLVSVNIKWEPFKMVSSAASFIVELGQSQSFISRAGAELYSIEASSPTVGAPILIILRYADASSGILSSTSFLIMRLPLNISRRVLLPNGDTITVTPIVTADGQPAVEVRS